MMTNEVEAGGQVIRLGRVFPGGLRATSDEIAVAALIAGGLGILYAVRKGISGLGPIELAGSTISGLEFAGYLMVVGGTIRVLQTRFPDNPLVRASAFIY